MSPAFRSLLWKEWLERRRLFRLGVGLMLLYLGYGIAYEIEYRTRAFAASYFSTCLMFAWFSSVLLAMTTATGEYTQHTLKFSASLPVSLRQVGWARLLGAWGVLAGVIVIGALCITPLLASGIFEQAGLRNSDPQQSGWNFPDRPSLSRLETVAFLWTIAAIAIVASWNLVTWISLLGTWCRSEGTVGLIGAIVGLFFTALTFIRFMVEEAGLYFLADWMGGVFPQSMAINWGYGDIDGSHYADLELAPLIIGPLAINALITLGLGHWFACRYGRRAESPVRNGAKRGWRFVPKLPSLFSRVKLRFAGPWDALVWLNARQSVPLCFAGLALAVLITLIGLIEQPLGDVMAPPRASIAARLAGELPSSTWFVGMLWGAVVAVGVFASELPREREHFWRSRPISPATWFWMKFFVGLIALLFTLDVIPLLLAQTTPPQLARQHAGVAYLACLPLLHALSYAAAVMFVCRWRKAIPAAIAALLLFTALELILQSIPVHPRLSTIEVYNRLESAEYNRQNGMQVTKGRVDLTKEGYPLVYGVVAAVIVIATLSARRTALSPVALKAVLLTVCLFGANILPLMADEPAEVKQFIEGIEAREAAIHDLHLKWKTRTETPFTQPTRRRRAAPSVSSVPQIDEKLVEYFARGPKQRAWMDFKVDGSIRNTTTFDGKLRRNYHGKRNNANSVSDSEVDWSGPTDGPLYLLTMLGGTPIPDRLRDVQHGEVTRRHVDGEELLDWTGTRTTTTKNENGISFTYEYRYEMTVNVSRNFWPIRLATEVFEQSSGRLISRNVITTEGWLDAGPISFPRRLEQHAAYRYENQPQNSSELQTSKELTCDVELAEVNSGFPETVFTDPFPEGAVYYDFRDNQWHEIGPGGTPSIYIPQPRGLRGAVLTYHLIWITAAGVYFFYWRPRSARLLC